MLDKRILKTKKNIKNTMINLLEQNPFEKITVAQLCRVGEVSRITFYTYYDDKYALLDEMFSDYITEARNDYRRLQNENNPQKNALRGYQNMLDCIINLYYNNERLFSQAEPDKNPYLYSAFFSHMFSNVVNYINSHNKQIISKYSVRQTAALLCSGLWGVINECYSSKDPRNKVRKNVSQMYHDILSSDLFIVKN